MNELIKVRAEKGKQLVSGRELHEFLEVKTAYKDWFPRMCEYGFIEEIDFSSFLSNSTGGRPSQDHTITIEMGKEISMLQRTEKGKQARRYFIECEKQLKENQLTALPQDYLTALKALVTSEEEKALMKPKVEYFEKVLQPSEETENGFIKLLISTQIAKDLGMTATKLNKALHDKGIIYKKSKTWFLYKEHENKIPEYCDYTINEFGQTLKFTELGRKWIIEILEK